MSSLVLTNLNTGTFTRVKPRLTVQGVISLQLIYIASRGSLELNEIFSLIFRGCRSVIGDVKKITRRPFVPTRVPCASCSRKASGGYLTQPEVGRAPLFLRAASSLLPSSRAPEAALRIMGVRLPNTYPWGTTSTPWRRYRLGTRYGRSFSRKSDSKTFGSPR